jgi:hypothetical protein
MDITGGQGQCFIPSVVLESSSPPENWKHSNNNVFSVRGIGVGMFNWWEATDKLIALATDQKDVSK